MGELREESVKKELGVQKVSECVHICACVCTCACLCVNGGFLCVHANRPQGNAIEKASGFPRR